MRLFLSALIIASALVASGNAMAGGGQGNAAREAFFEKLDKNKDGFLSREELQAMPSSTKPKKLDAMLKELDKDVDGKLSKEEFMTHQKKKDSPKKKSK